MLLACSVDTPIHNSMFHLLALHCVTSGGLNSKLKLRLFPSPPLRWAKKANLTDAPTHGPPPHPTPTDMPPPIMCYGCDTPTTPLTAFQLAGTECKGRVCFLRLVQRRLSKKSMHFWVSSGLFCHFRGIHLRSGQNFSGSYSEIISQICTMAEFLVNGVLWTRIKWTKKWRNSWVCAVFWKESGHRLAHRPKTVRLKLKKDCVQNIFRLPR